MYISKNVAPGYASSLINIATTQYDYDNPQQQMCNGS